MKDKINKAKKTIETKKIAEQKELEHKEKLNTKIKEDAAETKRLLTLIQKMETTVDDAIMYLETINKLSIFTMNTLNKQDQANLIEQAKTDKTSAAAVLESKKTRITQEI